MPLARTALHRITTVHGPARRDSRSFAACVRQQEAVDVEECLTCPHLMTFEGGGPGKEHLVCVTEEDHDEATAPGTVGRFMTRDVICVRPDVSVEIVAALQLQRGISGVPVVDESGRPVGIVSKTDVLRAYAQGRMHDDLDTFDVAASRRPAHTAREVMVPTPVTVHESDPIAQAADVLLRQRIHRAPVLSAEGGVVGIITAFDLLRAVAGGGAELTMDVDDMP